MPKIFHILAAAALVNKGTFGRHSSTGAGLHHQSESSWKPSQGKVCDLIRPRFKARPLYCPVFRVNTKSPESLKTQGHCYFHFNQGNSGADGETRTRTAFATTPSR